MSKMYIMVGLPASGKSTRAQEIVRYDGNTIRINKDLLRTMLHFDKFTGKNEGKTKDAARAVAEHFLLNGTNVVIDDTNLNPGTLQSWKDLAIVISEGIGNPQVKVQVVKMETSVEECLKRDSQREKRVGAHVIVGMAMAAEMYPRPEKGIVICDIDGTLADATHRLKHLNGDKKDWKSFFEEMHNDTPIEETISTLCNYQEQGVEIFLVSGRPDDYRKVTEEWLGRNIMQEFPDGKGRPLPYTALFMRKAGDSRQDDIVKQEIYDRYFKDKYPVRLVIDDRPSVIRMWRSNGLSVLDVGDGREF